jgi:L-lactate dehydrogenase complex protein LldE
MRVSLFIPCLVDRFYPHIGMAATRLLEMAGVTVSYDPRQTCCGQPSFNAGHLQETIPFARRLLRIFDGSGSIVAPSGSCVAMVREGYGMLDLPEEDMQRWAELRGRIFELSEFMHNQELLKALECKRKVKAVVHDSCHHLRFIGAKGPLDALLARVDGLEVLRSPSAEQCCGFGGVFSMKLPDLSIAMGRSRAESMLALKPDVIALADAGCIMHLEGVLKGMGVEYPPIVHYAQLLTGDGLEGLGD